uniref:Uncharacterized protein n=1 Tax=Romanomermis culicivorax TaxID=13658 RepID=A0A915I1E6_ROMCU
MPLQESGSDHPLGKRNRSFLVWRRVKFPSFEILATNKQQYDQSGINFILSLRLEFSNVLKRKPSQSAIEKR